MSRSGRLRGHPWVGALLLAAAAGPAPWTSGARAQEAGGVPGAVGERVTARVPGPPITTAILQGTLAADPIVLRADTGDVVLPRTLAVSRPVLIVGGDAYVSADVGGDLVVVGGDLWVRPGAQVRGDAVAIGGGVYPSGLARIEGQARAFRDVAYEIHDVPGEIVLVGRTLDVPGPAEEPTFALPGLYGVRIPPTYDRVNGVSLPFGPALTLAGGRLRIDPVVVYRSDLGDLDPWLTATARLGRRWSASAAAGRGTFTNDDWIRGPVANSILSLANGNDTRNYWRADRVEGRLTRLWRTPRGDFEAFAGGRLEDASTIGPDTGAVSSPWSLVGRTDEEDGMRRPNPPVDEGRIASALIGGEVQAELSGEVEVEATAILERALDTPSGDEFTQLTVDAGVSFPTFGSQRFVFFAHAVTTAGGVAPRQRWAYLGGSGTLPTFDLLVLGGDELLFLESRYVVPIERIRLPVVNASPVFMVRHMVGAASPGGLGELEQNLGARLTLLFLKLDVVTDPATGDVEFGAGLNFRL